MNVMVPKFKVGAVLAAAMWAAVRGTWIDRFVSHRAQIPMAYDMLGLRSPFRGGLAAGLFGMELRGAGGAWESRRWLQPASDAEIATTGNNTVNFNVLDYFEVAIVGFYWTVTGTVTAMVMDFDKYPRVAAGGTVVDKLDGTNGVLSGFAVGDQTQGKLWYNDIADKNAPVTIEPGQSIQAIVTTTTTAGNGLPFVVGWTKNETFRNLSVNTAVRMPNT
jgi:hypothetical protein